MKRLTALLIVLVMVISLTACQSDNGAEGNDDKEGFVVGVTSYGTATIFSRNARDVVHKKITELGGTYIDNMADTIVGRTDAIDTFVAQGVDAIILIIGDVTECAPNIAAAAEKGIVIGSVDGGIADGVDIYTSSDNYLIGESVMTALADKMGGSGDVVQIYNDLGSMDRRRKGGAADVIATSEGLAMKWQMVYAWPDYFPDIKSKMEAQIQSSGPEIDGIFATFDGVGLAALQAVREAGLEDQIPIVGVDGDPEALKEIADPNSAFYATVIQSWDECANICVSEVFRALEGNKLSTDQILVPGILVTKENVEEIREEYPELFGE